MRVAAVIPARMGSSRYPGKPLVDILGIPMIEHVYRRTLMAESVEDVYVATCDEEIHEASGEFGARAIMTSSEHRRASDRVAEAARSIDAEVVVMVQGDEATIEPGMVDAAVEGMLADVSVNCVNLCKKIETKDEFEDPNTVKVVRGVDDRALYFSRSPIPSLYDEGWGSIHVMKQVCVIPFRRSALLDFADLEPTPLERAESIDMLRFLEHDRPVHLVETDEETQAVDVPADRDRAEELLARDPLTDQYTGAATS